MRLILLLTIFLVTIQISAAVGNRVFSDVTQLKKLGFEVTVKDGNAEGLLSLRIIAPKGFDLGANDGGIKPYAGISYIKTLQAIEDGPGLIGAPATLFPLQSRLLEDGRHESAIIVQGGDLENSYFMVTFNSHKSGDWSMLIYIPISRVIEGGP
jgi:hypothetical protein